MSCDTSGCSSRLAFRQLIGWATANRIERRFPWSSERLTLSSRCTPALSSTGRDSCFSQTLTIQSLISVSTLTFCLNCVFNSCSVLLSSRRSFVEIDETDWPAVATVAELRLPGKYGWDDGVEPWPGTPPEWFIDQDLDDVEWESIEQRSNCQIVEYKYVERVTVREFRATNTTITDEWKNNSCD